METHTTEDPATTPYPTHSASEAVTPICGHGRLDHFQRLRVISRVNFQLRPGNCNSTCPNDVTLTTSISTQANAEEESSSVTYSNMFNPAPTVQAELETIPWSATRRKGRILERTQQIAELDRLLFHLGSGHFRSSRRHLELRQR